MVYGPDDPTELEQEMLLALAAGTPAGDVSTTQQEANWASKRSAFNNANPYLTKRREAHMGGGGGPGTSGIMSGMGSQDIADWLTRMRLQAGATAFGRPQQRYAAGGLPTMEDEMVREQLRAMVLQNKGAEQAMRPGGRSLGEGGRRRVMGEGSAITGGPLTASFGGGGQSRYTDRDREQFEEKLREYELKERASNLASQEMAREREARELEEMARRFELEQEVQRRLARVQEQESSRAGSKNRLMQNILRGFLGMK